MATEPESAIHTLIAFIDTKLTSSRQITKKHLHDWRHNHQKQSSSAKTSTIETALGVEIGLQNLPQLLRSSYSNYPTTRTIINNIINTIQTTVNPIKLPDLTVQQTQAFHAKLSLVTVPPSQAKLSATKQKTPTTTPVAPAATPASTATAAVTPATTAPPAAITQKIARVQELLTRTPPESPAKRLRSDSPPQAHQQLHQNPQVYQDQCLTPGRQTHKHLTSSSLNHHLSYHNHHHSLHHHHQPPQLR